MNEDNIKQYVVSGGQVFSVTGFDIVRDGGTQVIFTTHKSLPKLYRDHKNDTWHNAYPLTLESKIDDDLLIGYIKYSVSIFYIRQIEKLKMLRSFVSDLGCNDIPNDSDMIDFIQGLMCNNDNYCEVFLAGLRNSSVGKATAYQFETSPQIVETISAPTLREVIYLAMKNHEAMQNMQRENKGTI